MRYAEPRIAAALTCACLLIAGPTAAMASADPGKGNGGHGNGNGNANGNGKAPHPAAAAPGLNAEAPGNADDSGPGKITIGGGPAGAITGGPVGIGNIGGGKISGGNGSAGSTGSLGKAPVIPPSLVALKPPKIGSSGGANSGNNGSRPISVPQPVVTAGDQPALVTSVPEPELVAVSVRLPAEAVAVTPVQPMAILVARQTDSGTPTDGDGLSMIVRGITPVWAGAQPDGMWESLYVGLIGLVLMPLAGLWIGYQQIRAERATGKISGG